MKVITRRELLAVVTELLVGDGIDEEDSYVKFFTELATLVGDFTGVYVTDQASIDREDPNGEWCVCIEGDEDTPDPSIWDAFDPEGELERS